MKRFLLIIALLSLAACLPEKPMSPAVAGSPEEIVKTYYNAWSVRDYKTMYSVVSDGWKALEPTAKTEADFAAYMVGFYDKADRITLVSATETHNTGSEAVVHVVLETRLKDGRIVASEQDLTLRKKKNGWKMIHPYGEYSDLS